MAAHVVVEVEGFDGEDGGGVGSDEEGVEMWGGVRDGEEEGEGVVEVGEGGKRGERDEFGEERGVGDEVGFDEEGLSLFEVVYTAAFVEEVCDIDGK